MTLTALPAPIILGPQNPIVVGMNLTTTLGSQNTTTFDGAADGMAIVFQAQSTTVPDLVSFVVNAVTVAGTTGDIEATLQTVDASSGLPSGTIVTNSNTATSTISTTGVKTISGIAGTATVTVGEFYAIVIQAGSGWDRTMTINYNFSGNVQQGFPYITFKNGAGAWSKSNTGTVGWQMGIADSSGNYMYIPGCCGAASVALQSFSNATNPDERGNRFVVNAPTTCIGVQVWLAGGPGANDSFTIALYSGHTGTPSTLASKAVDGDYQVSGAGHTIYFDTAVNLSAGTTYAVALKADGTDTASIPRHDYSSNAHLGNYFSTSFYSTTRNNGSGAFTDDDAKVYAIFPVLSQFDDAAGGGGLAANPIRGFVG